MTDQKKTPSGGDRIGADKYRLYPQLTKPICFPQAPLLWQAHCECYRRAQDDPTPVNRAIARIVAEQWKTAFKSGTLP